ncbi:MAG: PQQ-dependent sugar dehydrogenase [Bacteroidota bacterium]
MAKFLLSALALLSIFLLTQRDIVEAPELTGSIETERMSIRIDTILADLESPWGMVFLPDGGMLFTEKKGELRLYKDGKLHPKPIGGLPEVRYKGQGGLLDIELHPDYAHNGWLYISYSEPAQEGEAGDPEGGNTTFIRARLQNHHLINKEVIFNAKPNYKQTLHYGGRIEFDQQGYLYLTVGDRGGRPEAQLLSTYRGKVLRLNDDGSIPADNPFVGRDGAHPEIYSYGHRNPQGLALNPVTGQIWEHEHGPRGGDEVNIVQKGLNFGWPTISYGINYDGSILTEDTVMEGMEQPVIFWRPSIAPCGMSFLSSSRYPQWEGNLLVGSLKFRYLARCEVQNDQIVHQEKLLDGLGRVRVVRQSPDGYIYVGTEAPGLIVRILPSGS